MKENINEDINKNMQESMNEGMGENTDENIKNRVYYKETFDEIRINEVLAQQIIRLKDKKTQSLTCRRKKIIATISLVLVFVTCATSIAAKATGFIGFRLFWEDDYSGYEMQIEIKKVPPEVFSGDIKEVKELVLKQIEEYEPYMNTMPNWYHKSFETVNLAMEYMGIDFLEHPLAGEKMPVELNINCNDKGEILDVAVEAEYLVDGNRIQISSSIFTELSRISLYNEQNSITMQSIAMEMIEYIDYTGELGSGQQVQIVEYSLNERGIICVDCGFVKGEVLYQVHVISDGGDRESAKNTLQNIIDLY